jgi:hypothetical protein
VTDRSTRAGTPATTTPAGTSLVTTAPAATTESSPTVTPCSTVAAVQIHTPPLDGDRRGDDLAPPEGRVDRVPGGDQAHPRPDEDLVADRDAADVVQRAVVVDEHVAADPDVDALIRVHRGDQPERRIDRGVRQLRPHGADRVLIGVRQAVQAFGQRDRATDPLEDRASLRRTDLHRPATRALVHAPRLSA